MFGYLYNWLGKSPINEETQESMEKYLLDYTYIGIDSNDKNSNPLIDYSMFSNNLTKLLINKKKYLLNIINNFRNTSHDIKKGKKVNQKETSRHFLNVLLSEVKNEEIIAIIFGRLMRIITRYNRFYTNDGSLDIFQEICDNIITDYIYSLYTKYLGKINKNKEINKHKLYSLSN